MDRRRAEALSRLDRTQLIQLSEILAKAEGVALLSPGTDSEGQPPTPAGRAALELKAVLSSSDDLHQTIEAALRLQSLASLPPGQRPTVWEGPTSSELFDLTTSWDKLYPIKWWQFEHLVAEIFRRLGFDDVKVVEGGLSGDGGADIRMTYQGAPCIVQCKHYAADEYVPIERIRAFAHVAQREQATGYLVTSGKVGVTARREMSKADPQVFVVDGEWVWTWIGRARGENKEEVLLPGRQAPKQSTSNPEDAGASARLVPPATATKSGCISIVALTLASAAAVFLGVVHLLS